MALKCLRSISKMHRQQRAISTRARIEMNVAAELSKTKVRPVQKLMGECDYFNLELFLTLSSVFFRMSHNLQVLGVYHFASVKTGK